MTSTKWKKGLAGLLTGGGAIAAVFTRCRGRQHAHQPPVTEPEPHTTPATTPHPQESDGSPVVTDGHDQASPLSTPSEVHGDADAV
jgi:hypothetical protein